MEKIIIFLSTVLLICFSGSVTGQIKKLTKIEEQKIRKEIKSVTDIILKNGKTDVDAIVTCYANVPEFIALSTEGKIENYKAYMADLRNALTGTSQQITTISYHTTVLAADMVVDTWLGDDVIVFPDGSKMEFKNMSCTFIFKKIGKEWKIIYSHESVAPTTATTAADINPLANTRWAGNVNIPTPTDVVFEYKTDTLNMIIADYNMVGETMKYTVKGDTLTLQKLSGNSPCGTSDIGIYTFKIVGDKLLFTSICKTKITTCLNHISFSLIFLQVSYC